MPRLFPALALFSLACSVALAGLWARSYWREDWVLHHSASGLCWGVTASRGSVVVGWQQFTLRSPMWLWGSKPAPAADPVPGAVGWEPGAAWFPIAAPVMLAMVPPAAWAWRRRKGRARGFEVRLT